MLVIRHEELRSLVSMADAVDAMAGAFAAVVDGTADMPVRVGTEDGSGLAMIATRRSPGGPRTGIAFKAIGIRAGNRERGLPAINALVLWLDPETAAPSLLVDGTSLTALRTGAASGLATRLLAPREAATLAMIGAGGQAADQIRAVCAVRPIEHVRISSRSGRSAALLAASLARELPGIAFEAVGSAVEAIAGAEVISTATNALDPVIPEGLEGRIHVNAVGSFRPDMHELPQELLPRAEILAIDERHAALAESGELIDAIAADPGFEARLVELGRLVLDPPSPTGVTIFKSVGMAMQDWAICSLLDARIRENGAPAGVLALDLTRSLVG